MTEEEAPNTTFLKSVVIILGILILGVAGLIIFTIYKRALTPSSTPEVSSIPSPEGDKSQSPSNEFGDIVLETPNGMSPIGVSSSGERLIIIYGKDLSHPQLIVIVHQSSGRVLGRITLQE